MTGSASRWAHLVATSPLAMVVLDDQCRVVEANAAARRLLCQPVDGVSGERLPLEEARILERLCRGETIAGVEATIVHADGSRVPVALHAAPRDAEGDAAVGVVMVQLSGHRLQDRNREESWPRETLASFEAVLNSYPIALVLLDAEFRVRIWSPAAERLFGWTAAEVVGSTAPFVPLNRKQENAELRRRALERAEGVSDFETERLRKDGTAVAVATYSTPIRDEDGALAGVVLAYIDLTDRRRLEAELVAAQKMEAVARLAGGVAHDFNNLLTAIIGYADLAQSMAEEPDLHRVLATVEGAAERAAGLTRQLLAFSRQQMLRPQVIDAREVALAMEPILRRLLGDEIGLDIAVSPNTRPILIDRTQLEQVILNLATNARDAMPNGGRLAIRAETTQIDSARPYGAIPAGDCTVISISDTGLGMDETTRAHVFEPFFTTKGPGKGTGLGLSTTYGIVVQSGGQIDVTSELGNGTTFKLVFPVAATTGVELPPAQAVSDLRRARRILLAEDEPTVRDLAETVLVRAGFEVHAAPDAEAALAFVADGGDVDLLLTDVVMPGMTGIELARLLRERWRDLPVLLMSGYSVDVTRDAGIVPRRLLAKPFTPTELRRAVDEALNEAPRASQTAEG
jgi:two-component system, cell cycle sensor histidine kinase and response regulator CckA